MLRLSGTLPRDSPLIFGPAHQEGDYLFADGQSLSLTQGTGVIDMFPGWEKNTRLA
jgi:hypothetical protein